MEVLLILNISRRCSSLCGSISLISIWSFMCLPYFLTAAPIRNFSMSLSMLPGCELLVLYSMGYSGIYFVLALLLSSKVLGWYLQSLNLFARAFLYALRCSSEFFLALEAAQLFMCFATSSSSIFLRIASSFCFRMRRKVLCLASLMFYSAIISSSAFGSSLNF